MWSNLTGVVGAAIQKVREIESQLDSAVGVENKSVAEPVSTLAEDSSSEPNSPTPQHLSEPTAAPTKEKKPTTKDSFSSPSMIQPAANTAGVDSETPATVTTRRKKSSISPKNASSLSTTSVSYSNSSSNNLAASDSESVNQILNEKNAEIQRLTFLLAEEKTKQQKETALLQEQLSKAELQNQQHILEAQRQAKLLKESEVYRQTLQSQLETVQTQAQQTQTLLLALQQKQSDNNNNTANDNTSSNGSNGHDAAEQLQQLQRTVTLQAETQRATLLESQKRLQELQELESQAGQRINELENQLQETKRVLEARETLCNSQAHQLAEALTLQELTKETLQQRERQLADLQTQLAEANTIIANNTAAVANCNANTNNNSANNDQMVSSLRSQLAAYEAEGKTLAKKQSEMEKSVRLSKQSLREKETEVTKLKESKEQLVKALEQTQEALKKQEAETDKVQKALTAMQAVTAASADRLTRLESDLQVSHEEQSATKRALENAWNELAEQKKHLTEARSEADDLKKQLGEGASRVLSTESQRREVEQREAVLRATSQQLQDQLQRAMGEATVREDRLRDELTELRRRWQEAVSSRETLASELASASAPLLRQISALQEQLRLKTEQWSLVETNLIDRAVKSETAAEQYEHRRTLLEEQTQSLKLSLSQAQQQRQELVSQVQDLQDTVSRMQRVEARHSEEKSDWQQRLAQEISQVSLLNNNLREIDLRHRLTISEMTEAQRDMEKRLTTQCEELQKEIATLRDTLSKYQNDNSYNSNSNSLMSPRYNGKNNNNGSNNGILSESDVHYNNQTDGKQTSSINHISNNNNSHLGSFVASERQQQRQRQQQEELQSLQTLATQLKCARDALLEEVNFLSVRNAQLEDATSQLPLLQEQQGQLSQQVEVLLLLLGEKEEQVEALSGDLQETKYLYRAQLDELLTRCLHLEQVQSALDKSVSPALAYESNDHNTSTNSNSNNSPKQKQQELLLQSAGLTSPAKVSNGNHNGRLPSALSTPALSSYSTTNKHDNDDHNSNNSLSSSNRMMGHSEANLLDLSAK